MFALTAYHCLSLPLHFTSICIRPLYTKHQMVGTAIEWLDDPPKKTLANVQRSVNFCSLNVHLNRLKTQTRRFPTKMWSKTCIASTHQAISSTCVASSAYVGVTPITLECHLVAKARNNRKMALPATTQRWFLSLQSAAEADACEAAFRFVCWCAIFPPSYQRVWFRAANVCTTSSLQSVARFRHGAVFILDSPVLTAFGSSLAGSQNPAQPGAKHLVTFFYH